MAFWVAVLAGFLTGILSAFGIGGGTLLLVYLTAFAHMEQTQAQGINLLYFLPTALTALIQHYRSGYLDFRLAWSAILPGFGAILLAICTVSTLKSAVLRVLFGLFLLTIGIYEEFLKNPK